MVTAVSTIANGGAHVTPRVVKQIVYKNTGEVKDIEIKKEEGVISEKTSKDVLSMMKSVVQEGTGKNAKVEGYSIGGKTGTSEDGVNTGKYVTSFIGVASIEDPEIVVLVTLYNPTGEGGHQGGGVAAPLGGQIFSEILPYLDVNQGNTEEIENVEQIQTPDILNKSIKETEKILKESGLNYIIEDNTEEIDKENTYVKEQTPSAGIVVNKGSNIYLKIK